MFTLLSIIFNLHRMIFRRKHAVLSQQVRTEGITLLLRIKLSFLELLNNECSTFSFALGGVNVAEALVSKGLATCVRYSADNDQRSSKYDDLLAAEDKALKSNKGKATNEQILTEGKTS